MRLPHNVGAAIVVATLLVSPLLNHRATVHAQDPDSAANQTTEHGIDLFRKGDLAGAVKVLDAVTKKHPSDPDAWYYLGLSYYDDGYIGYAGPAFEHVVELRPNSASAYGKLSYALILGNEPQRAMAMAQRALELGDQSAEAHYAIAEASLRAGTPSLRTAELSKAVEEADTALRINPTFTLALITKSFAQSALGRDAEASASLERFLAITPDDPDAALWREQLEVRQTQTSPTPAATLDRPFNGKDVTRKARVLSKPEPQYSEAARRAGVTGTVVIRCVFSSTGEVTHLVVVRALGFGLTNQAAKAAKRIKFDPALKDGQPVSMYMQLEYNFNLY